MVRTDEFGRWAKWLYQQDLACVREDNQATTWASCGCVLLAAAVTTARSAISLSDFTGFPEEFTELVLEIMQLLELSSDTSFSRLKELVRDMAADSADIKLALDSVLDTFLKKSIPLVHELERARNYRVLGGGRQDWVDDGELCLLLEQLEEQYSIDDLGAF
jgi:hypothetical protein